jgi:hypothetical protein
VRRTGAAGSCARCARRAAALHVAPRCHEVLDACRHERRSGGALCVAQRVRCCAAVWRTGAAGSCAQHKRSTAAPHVAPR